MPPTASERKAFYRSALHLLHFVEHRSPTGRRFGKQADALWSGFAGSLDVRDRIELLLRDADAHYRGAFGARTTFDLAAVAQDDAFGSEWEGLPAPEANELWRELTRATPPADPEQVFALLDKTWSRKLKPFTDLPKISPSSRIVVTGIEATLALIRRCLADRDLSWADQVVVIANAPMPRQYASAALALLDIDLGARPSPLLSATDAADPERAKPLGTGRTVILSPDAEPEAATAAKRLGS